LLDGRRVAKSGVIIAASPRSRCVLARRAVVLARLVVLSLLAATPAATSEITRASGTLAESGAPLRFVAHRSLAGARSTSWPLPLDSTAPKDREAPGSRKSDAHRRGGRERAKAPVIRFGRFEVSPGVSAEVVRRILRQNLGRFRLCYARGLERDARLHGSVPLHFSIDPNGHVSNAHAEGSTLRDAEMVRCSIESIQGLSFPKPDRAGANVLAELQFFPPSAATE
jgi:hypothetical protein